MGYLKIVIFALLDMLASFSIINVAISILGFCLIKCLWDFRAKSLRATEVLAIGFVFLIASIVLGFAVNRLMELKSLGELYYGIESFRGSVHSLVRASNGFSQGVSLFSHGMKWLILLSILLMAIWLILRRDLGSIFGPHCNQLNPRSWVVCIHIGCLKRNFLSAELDSATFLYTA